jgi:serine/threonine-protein kinase
MFCPRCHRRYDADHRFCPYDGETLVDGPRIDLLPCKPTRMAGELVAGRYALRGFIGKGAMARVYLAEDTRTHRPVAVKILSLSPAQRTQARASERLFREAQAAAKIGHPAIVEVFDVGEHQDGSPFLVMEHLFGESLGDFLRRDGKVDVDIGLPILQQVASGLGAAHAVGVVHRDVKPDNIFLVGEPGDPYAVKVVDFGLAKLEALSSVTATGTAVGTLEYMAPEQVLGDAPDARTDVYGLGVVMYRMFTGDLPFKSRDDADLLAEQIYRVPPPPSERAKELDASLDAVVLRAMRKSPANRYPSMAALRDDLERLMGERPGPLAAVERTPSVDEYEPVTDTARAALEFFRLRRRNWT